MTKKPVFVATHPRACSTAFERVFMTRRDRLRCVHEPFGDAFYFGPERLGTRYENDEEARKESGFADSTYKSIFDAIMEENAEENKQIFIKDITHYLVPPSGNPASIAPSLQKRKRGVGTETPPEEKVVPSEYALKTVVSPTKDAVQVTNGHSIDGAVNSTAPYPYPTVAEPNNPTVIPKKILEQFHFAFLIRHPVHSIPSYWRCTIPPLDEITGFHNFMPEEAGYDEQRRVFDYLKNEGIIGPAIAGQETNGNGNGNGHANGHASGNEICVIDADDLLNNPEGIMRKFCASVGIDFEPSMLEWDTPEDHKFAKDKFEKWRGFHEDAINSSGLKARTHKKPEKTDAEYFDEWKNKYGEDAAKVIQDTVKQNVADYEYMKKFAIKA
ncbi:hypothetical protein MBLNU457_1977t1 [Dothideomycetes sp. NU457]